MYFLMGVLCACECGQFQYSLLLYANLENVFVHNSSSIFLIILVSTYKSRKYQSE